ncbi:YeiH family protein [Kutzneria albida]|nr:putative sulfate exporter family transporter [Kutzneria albida]
MGILMVAVLVGVVVGNLPVLPSSVRPVLSLWTKRLLRAGVVLVGLQLAVPQVLALGAGTVLAVVVTVAVTFFGTLALGRLFGVSRGLSMLVATGFSICGASAIAAAEGVVESEEDEVATAVALVTVFGSLTMLTLPLLADGLALGRWSGLTVQEVAQVVVAASPAGAAAVGTAVAIKLSRVVLLAPVVAGMGVWRRAANSTGERPPLVPVFVLGFLAMVVLRSLDVLPAWALDLAKDGSTWLLAGALFGLGCAVRLRAMAKTGLRALLLGAASTVLVVGTGWVSLAVLG